MRLLALPSGIQTGIYNMALDEALLEWVRVQPKPVLWVRTYRWDVPTLSLGVNQKVRDLDFLLRYYGQGQNVGAIVRRPTGGRAILHGQDISFSFITNHPPILQQSLKEAYAILSGIVRQALETLGLQTRLAADAGTRDYLRSPVCFQTHTPSDLLARDGKKLSGSAQLRRSGGLLQHGAAFLAPWEIQEKAFFEALCQVGASTFGEPCTVLSSLQAEALIADWPQWLEVYARASNEILDKVSTTSGSHLLPASR